MREITQRGALYSGASIMLAGIAVWWGTTSAEADVLTMLSSADVQLRMAYTIPEYDRDGARIEEREALIDAAVGHLADVERLQPGLAVTAEFRGFAHMLRGRFLEAADCYRQARACDDCEDEQFDVLAFNEARMLAKAGSRERALAVFASHGEALDARWGHQRALEEATILRELGRRADAIARLDPVLRDGAAMPMARLQAGREYLELGLFDQAGELLLAVREELPIADYHLARLKLRQGDVDTCFELLSRATESRPTEVRRMLRDEAEAWSDVAEDPRFIGLTEPVPASPGR